MKYEDFYVKNRQRFNLHPPIKTTMPLTIRDPSLSPPEKKWTFYVKETDHTVSVSEFVNLRNAVVRHCLANGATPPSQEEIVKYCCDNLTIDCREDGQPYMNMFAKQEAYVHPDYRAIPRDQWPLWAKTVALVAISSDAGIGDTIARTVGPIGGDTFKAWHRTVFGKECDCTKRQARFNAQFPLP